MPECFSGRPNHVSAASPALRWRYVSKRNGGVDVIARAYHVSDESIFGKLGIAGFGRLLLFAVLIGIRRPDNQDARILAALLAWTLGGMLYRGNTWIPWIPLSIVFGGILALLLGTGFRFVHRRVEGVVDQLLFRKRRADIEAISGRNARARHMLPMKIAP